MLTVLTRNFELVEHNSDEKDIFHITVKKKKDKKNPRGLKIQT